MSEYDISLISFSYMLQYLNISKILYRISSNLQGIQNKYETNKFISAAVELKLP